MMNHLKILPEYTRLFIFNIRQLNDEYLYPTVLKKEREQKNYLISIILSNLNKPSKSSIKIKKRINKNKDHVSVGLILIFL